MLCCYGANAEDNSIYRFSIFKCQMKKVFIYGGVCVWLLLEDAGGLPNSNFAVLVVTAKHHFLKRGANLSEQWTFLSLDLRGRAPSLTALMHIVESVMFAHQLIINKF